MDFEQALRSELSQIDILFTKIFPMAAPESTNTPFLIYSKSRVDLIKTLDGTSKTRDGNYEIDIVDDTYADLQIVFQDVKDKLVSLEGRQIGVNGPMVQMITIDSITEVFEDVQKYYRINIEFRAFYTEVA